MANPPKPRPGGSPLKARTPEERAAKLELREMQRRETGDDLLSRSIAAKARHAKNKADRAARQKRLEAESRARIEAKGGQGQRVILNARANLMVEDAAREGRELTFEEAKKIVVRDSRERWKDYLRSIGAIPGEARNPNPNR